MSRSQVNQGLVFQVEMVETKEGMQLGMRPLGSSFGLCTFNEKVVGTH